MSIQPVRTDLALEAHENMEVVTENMHGITVEEHYNEKTETQITKVLVTTKNGAKALNKPMGMYITIEAPNMATADEDYHREISMELSTQLKELIPNFEQEQSILVVGLGNREVTADALGPDVIDNLCITRHIVKAYGKAAYNKSRMHLISSLAPGVMAKNGMETAEIIKGVVEQTHPDLMIVIDALAARSIKRLNRTIQITDTGIQPGSGVGNHRDGLTKESLGIPVIAIGVPTVVDAATIVRDALSEQTPDKQPEALSDLLNSMYVTSKDIDDVIKQLSYTISEALNMAFELS